MLDDSGLRGIQSDQLEQIDEFRQVRHTAVLCVAFGDIVGSTPLLETVGIPAYQDLMATHERSVTALVQRDGAGAMVQWLGDGFLAVFSEPSTTVERSLEIQAALRSDAAPGLRIGIDMGQVAISRRSPTDTRVLGRHVHRAQRIESIAEPGSVLTSFVVYDSAVGWLKDRVHWNHQPPRTLKGFTEPVTVHEPVPLAPVTMEPWLRTRGGLTLAVGGSVADSFDPWQGALDSIRRAVRDRRSGVRVLWAADSPDHVAPLVQRLEAAGTTVQVVTSAADVLASITSGPPTAVILDLELGDDPQAGLALLDDARRAGSQLPFLFLTTPDLAAEHGSAALENGARVCTSGSVTLLRALADVLHESS